MGFLDLGELHSMFFYSEARLEINPAVFQFPMLLIAVNIASFITSTLS
jgi:hypothetical protein